MEGAQFTVGLEGGRQITGALIEGLVECRGRRMDARDIIALDNTTLFLLGAVQVEVAAERPDLKGFLELDVAGEGQIKLQLNRVETILRHPS